MCDKVQSTRIPRLFLVPEIRVAIIKLPMTWTKHCTPGMTESRIFFQPVLRPFWQLDCRSSREPTFSHVMQYLSTRKGDAFFRVVRNEIMFFSCTVFCFNIKYESYEVNYMSWIDRAKSTDTRHTELDTSSPFDLCEQSRHRTSPLPNYFLMGEK